MGISNTLAKLGRMDPSLRGAVGIEVHARAPKQSRITQLDGIRAIAILAVYLHHAFAIKLLWMGVDLFFILSGFLITGILLEHKRQPIGTYFREFYSRRVRRILPPYLLFMVITTILFGAVWMRHAIYYGMMMNFLVAFGKPEPPTLTVLWSLAVEEQFYLLWPFAVYFLNEAVLTWTAGALMIVVPALRWLCTPHFAVHWPVYTLTPFRADLLVVGALLALAWIHHRRRIERYGAYGLLLVPVAASLLYVISSRYRITTYSNDRIGNVVIYEASLLACTGIILWALSGRGVGVLKLGPVRYLGRISYTFYLISSTILFEMDSRFFHGRHLLANAIVSFLLIVLYSTLSWYLMELPILGSKPKESSAVLSSSDQPRLIGEKTLS